MNYSFRRGPASSCQRHCSTSRTITALLVAWFAANVVSGPCCAQEPEAIRGAFLDFTNDPFFNPVRQSVRFTPDGLLVLEDGKFKDFGRYSDLKEKYLHLAAVSYPDRLIVPGLVDCHIHYPQTRIVAAYGNQLLEWLTASVFPEEIKFKDAGYARDVASFFLDEMIRRGTTTVMSYTTTFPGSVDVFFEEATRRNMRVIAGLTGIDRNGFAPDAYLDTAESFYRDSKALYHKWHGKGRNLYAVTPRFAFGCSDEMLKRAGELYQELEGVYVNTHLSENRSEVAGVKTRFPDAANYLDVYDRAGLVGPRCVFGHSIYLNDSEFQRMSASGASIAFCPSSNLFLGSGLFKIAEAKSPRNPVRVGMGSDMGGGDNFGMLAVLKDAYKVGMLQGYSLSAFKLLYLATRGSAQALYLEEKVGTFDPGKEADFVVLDLMATPELASRNRSAAISSLDEVAFKTFGLIMLADTRAVAASYVAGKKLYERKP
jgi:guanine deaminase